MPLGLRPSYARRRAGWGFGMMGFCRTCLLVLSCGVLLMGCGERTAQRTQQDQTAPLLDLTILRSLKPYWTVPVPPGRPGEPARITQFYELSMDTSTAEREVRQDPGLPVRTRETTDTFGYAAYYVVDGRRIRVHIYQGEGAEAAPPGHCFLALNGPPAK